jgi:hypothetical protein
MQKVDFLPQEFRERASMRRSRIWQFAVLGFFGTIVLTSFGYQIVSRGSARSLLAEVTPLHSLAVQQALRHTELRSELASLQHQVSLYTYLKHPWPRTRILSSIARELPTRCVMTSLWIMSEVPKVASANAKPSTTKVELSGAEFDLKQIMESQRGAQSIIYISGVTDNPVKLHEFVARLSQSSLFAKAELYSFESLRDPVGRGGKFEVRAVLVPSLVHEPHRGEPARTRSASLPEGNRQ